MEQNFVDGEGIPLGFGMALAQNSEAMNYFAALDEQSKQNVINNCHGVRSKSEMRQYVSSLTEGNSFK
ncbi:hypothetical protein QA584_20890 [Anaerocolumna sp. AGMB13025]|uniref:hypothetical protein n=1 Tax=Anaerocolumna sp. AGMB13025 TaxID=3039116 RepID=UPI00241F977E|nr:hypothetical protein [Anaerocolumna sp. AGMB13025]WFR56051.1 hypothetical protein QA584_20890 [Anaerocolumna sp. AGMB13025]